MKILRHFDAHFLPSNCKIGRGFSQKCQNVYWTDKNWVKPTNKKLSSFLNFDMIRILILWFEQSFFNGWYHDRVQGSTILMQGSSFISISTRVYHSNPRPITAATWLSSASQESASWEELATHPPSSMSRWFNMCRYGDVNRFSGV